MRESNNCAVGSNPPESHDELGCSEAGWFMAPSVGTPVMSPQDLAVTDREAELLIRKGAVEGELGRLGVFGWDVIGIATHFGGHHGDVSKLDVDTRRQTFVLRKQMKLVTA